VFFSAWDIVGADDGWSRLTIGIPGSGKFNIFYSTIELGATTHKKGGSFVEPDGDSGSLRLVSSIHEKNMILCFCLLH